MTAHIQLRSKVPAQEAKAFLGRMIDEGSFDVLLTGDAVVYKPNGQKLCALRKNVLSDDLLSVSDKALDVIKHQSTNLRGTYAGGVRVKREMPDGSVKSVTVDPETGNEMHVASSIAGYYDRNPRFPFCRETAFTADEVVLWKENFVPLAQRVSEVFKETIPDRWNVQSAVASKASADFVIPGTPFSTLTINGTVRAAVHYDKGDLKEGFGCITARRRGRWTGHFLCFPEYRVAADIGNNDVLLFDPHEMHGNTRMISAGEDDERISVVYYFRSKISECGTAHEEMERAKSARGSL
jgi:hypothetical protein